MLVLSRKVGERIQVGNDITIVINRVVGNRVSVGIEAPGDVRIVRSELAPLLVEFSDMPERMAPAARTPADALCYGAGV